jgi:hypothetical protein
MPPLSMVTSSSEKQPDTQVSQSSNTDEDIVKELRNMMERVQTLSSASSIDEATADEAFWAVVNAVDTAEQRDLPLPAEVPQLFHAVLDVDIQLLQQREKLTTNLTCMMPDESEDDAGAARRMNYIFDDADIKNLPLTEGRKCEGGECSCACSRNIFPTFCGSTAAHKDHNLLDTFPEIASFTFNDLATVPAATILQFVRLIERVRRTIALEYGVPLKTVLPLQAYSRKYVAGSTQQGGGGGEGDFVTLHCDEATHTGYHYSCVIYLSTAGQDFEGGAFVFSDPEEKDEKDDMTGGGTTAGATTTSTSGDMDIDSSSNEQDDDLQPSFNYTALLEKIRSGEYVPDLDSYNDDDDDEYDTPTDDLYEQVDDYDDNLSDEQLAALTDEIRKTGRKVTPFYPTRGSAVIFSSGWENLHEVEKITAGVRYAVPCFFTTCPVPDAAYEHMNVGKPQSTEMIADDLLHLLLAHRKESPIESVGRVKELLMKWHYMCTPLSEH